MASRSESLRMTFSPRAVRRSLIVALIIGTVLNGINQGTAIWRGAEVDWWRAMLTYCVPFIVASYGSYGALRQR